jgi:hypothetical protein
MIDESGKENPDIVPLEDGMPVLDLDPVDPEGGQPPGEDDWSELDMMLELLQIFDVEYTLIQDESGATIEIAGGNRGTHGFQGVAVTMNFAPITRNEEFLFVGLTKL